MLTSANLSILFFSIFASITFNGFFRNIAKTNNILIDIPEKSRKFHDRATHSLEGFQYMLVYWYLPYY